MTATVVRRLPPRSLIHALVCWLHQAFAPSQTRTDGWPPRHPAEKALWAQDAQARRHSISKGRAQVDPGVRDWSDHSGRHPTSR